MSYKTVKNAILYLKVVNKITNKFKVPGFSTFLTNCTHLPIVIKAKYFQLFRLAFNLFKKILNKHIEYLVRK